MSEIVSFGALVKRRRRALDLTQEQLAQKVGYSVATIRHIEGDERKPSKELAERLAVHLQISEEERPLFLKAARSSFDEDLLATPKQPTQSDLPERPTPPVTSSPKTDFESPAPAPNVKLPSGNWLMRLWPQLIRIMGVAVAILLVVQDSPRSSFGFTPIIEYEMAYIPSGSFLQGSTRQQLDTFEELCNEAKANCHWDFFADELPQRSVTLRAYYIDVHEVTNEQFHQFIMATQKEDNKGYVTTAEKIGYSLVFSNTIQSFIKTQGADWLHPGGPATNIQGYEKYPVVHVSHDDAEAYCHWVQKRLPTEAEWEKAARGPDGWLFPWGNEWKPRGGNYIVTKSDGTEIVNGLKPVGSYPEGTSPYGVQDMLGNVSEWVADVYDPDYYMTAPDHNPYNANAPASHPLIQHSRRGGSWPTKGGYLHAAWRIDRPDETNDVVGFRCARNP